MKEKETAAAKKKAITRKKKGAEIVSKVMSDLLKSEKLKSEAEKKALNITKNPFLTLATTSDLSNSLCGNSAGNSLLFRVTT